MSVIVRNWIHFDMVVFRMNVRADGKTEWIEEKNCFALTKCTQIPEHLQMLILFIHTPCLTSFRGNRIVNHAYIYTIHIYKRARPPNHLHTRVYIIKKRKPMYFRLCEKSTHTLHTNTRLHLKIIWKSCDIYTSRDVYAYGKRTNSNWRREKTWKRSSKRIRRWWLHRRQAEKEKSYSHF